MYAGLVIVAAFGIAYLLDCAFWPYLYCLYCKGEKRKISLFSHGFRFCPTCGGRGIRRRFGKVLIDTFKSRR